MDVASFIRSLRQDPYYRRQIAFSKRISARRPKFGELKQPLVPELANHIKAKELFKFYSHQAQAINLIRERKNVVVATGTASGKSLCYNVPVLESIIKNRKNCALYIFPTKALTQDQLKTLLSFNIASVKAATYDGDTPRDDRAWVRRNANIVLTNPEMLNLGILPYHKMWGNFLLNLRYVVIDEMHTLRGVFGSNVANILRRLIRISSLHNSKPQFIFSSATIANPKELGESLIGFDVSVVKKDTAPQAARTVVFWNPPYIDRSKEVRKSSNSETAYLFTQLVRQELKNITFSKSRKTAELIFKFAKQQLEEENLASRIASYRAGYLPKERRKIEKQLFTGKLWGVSSTSALELGIDVGELNAAVINGYPGTIASFWQQAGRAGRQEEESLVFLVAQADALDQYYMKHPRQFFDKPCEEGVIDPQNSTILRKHLRAAAYESPLSFKDANYFGKTMVEALEKLEEEGSVVKRKNQWFWIKREFPAKDINVRSASENTYIIVEESSGELIGTVDENQAFFYIHPGAIYLHQGDTYLVNKLDNDQKVAFVESFYGDYFTQPRDLTDIRVIKKNLSKRVGRTQSHFGEVEVTTIFPAYQKRKVFTGEIIDEEELDLPPQVFQTQAFWFTVPDRVVKELGLSSYKLQGGIHAVEHAAIAILPSFTMCDRWDIGGVSVSFHNFTRKPTIFIYDGYQGGVGISERGYQLLKQVLTRILEVVTECKCRKGCPSCVQSPKCGNLNEPLDKEAAINILKVLVEKRH